jgi:1,4-alpha-glucan branching enzyme
MPPMTLLTEDDLHWFNEGTHLHLYHKLGSRPWTHEGVEGVYFAVWAPNASHVYVMGDFNGWSNSSHPLHPRASSGIWEGFFPGLRPGLMYKYHLVSRHNGYRVNKADPYAYHMEVPPNSASYVWTLDYDWQDDTWMRSRQEHNAIDEPISIYELHLGSWMRPTDRPGEFYSYREIAPKLVEHVSRMGFTHVEFMPVMEHPFYGSWGYQITGYFAPTSRYGTPQDFMYLIDLLHQNGIGVILDWVPSHFPNDEFALGCFDGTHLYEHADPRQGIHPDWNSYVFNYSRNEVRSFLLSNAVYWLDKYHVDGLRVDAVASMLYLDYSRKAGEWIPNRYGGRENLEAVSLLREFNTRVYADYPDAITVAEESTAWPGVSRPTYIGGLGFGYKWDMGWMHDTLFYMSHDPVHRQYHHDQLTFRMVYAFTENFILPLSHDEVVHGKGSLLEKMPGDDWQKFANLRLLLGYQFLQAGKKLLFMGGEFGQRREWDHDTPLDWDLLQYASHEGVQRWVQDLNRVYRSEPALHRLDCDPAGFEWISGNDSHNSVLVFLRKGHDDDRPVLVACNFTPVPRHNYRVGVPRGGFWEEILNSDAEHFGGSGHGNLGRVEATPIPSHGHFHSLNLTLPPLAAIALKWIV